MQMNGLLQVESADLERPLDRIGSNHPVEVSTVLNVPVV
jgi:hypothetical protein